MKPGGTDAALAERRAAYQNVTMADRAAKHAEVAALKAEELAVRRALGRDYLASHTEHIVVPPERAVACVDLIEQTHAARQEALALTDGRVAKIDNGALEFPVLGHHFAA